MTIVVPNTGEVRALTEWLTAGNLTLKLYSNDKTPAESDTAANYTEVSGGGYSSKTLSSGSWSIASGDPTVATYAYQDFSFTGATAAPGTIYGYFVVDASGILVWAERFEAAVVPYTPSTGKLVRITPKISVS